MVISLNPKVFINCPLWLVAILFFGAGCTPFDTGPRTEPLSAKVGVPETWKEPTDSLAATVPLVGSWWEIFHNDELTTLIEKALKNEPDVRRACARVQEFHAKTEVAGSRIFPRVEMSPGASIQKVSETDTPYGVKTFALRDDSFGRFAVPFNVSYSLDLFGRMKPHGRALKCDAAAARADLEAAGLLVSGEVARGYFLFQSLRAEVDTLEDALRDRKDAITIQKSLVDAGEENEQEFALARLEAATVEAELAGARGDLKLAAHALARLTGVAPACFTSPKIRRITHPPRVPAGVPCEVICRRPDIVSARRQLTAGLERVEAERLSYLPIIELTASGGMATADLHKIVDGNSVAWSVGSSLTKVLFDGGERKYRQKVRYAQYCQLAAQYDKTVLDALKEVEDALSRIRSLREKLAATEKAGRAANDLSAIARAQFGKGLTPYLSVIDSQRSRLSIRRKQNQLRGALNDATIQLIVALGGGCCGE